MCLKIIYSDRWKMRMPSERRAATRRVKLYHDILQHPACKFVGGNPMTIRRNRPHCNPEVRKEMNVIARKQ